MIRLGWLKGIHALWSWTLPFTHFTKQFGVSARNRRAPHIRSWMRKLYMEGERKKNEISLKRTIRIPFVIGFAWKWYRNRHTLVNTRNPFNMHTIKMGIIKNLMATIKICVLASLLSHQVNIAVLLIVAVCVFAFSLMFVSTERIVGFVFYQRRKKNKTPFPMCGVGWNGKS